MENKLAENIRAYRKSLGFTQDQLAERLGVTLGAVSKWERGSSEPDLAYIMDLAELFHVSVDALIGFSMHGCDADGEAARIEELGDLLDVPDSGRQVTVFDLAAEYDSALVKFPNHFRIVLGAGLIHSRIGIVYRRNDELYRALDLLRHALELFSQNKDPGVTELRIHNEIGGCYCALKDYKKAIEAYKMNNVAGNNDARIGMLLTLYEKNPEEGVRYTEKAFLNQFSDMITSVSGYLYYYISVSEPDRGIRMADWAVRCLEALKEDPAAHAYVDKIISLFLLGKAVLLEIKGLPEAAEEALRSAVQAAAGFDADPVCTLRNMILSGKFENISLYDNTGPTAVDGLKSSLEELAGWLPDGFAARFEKVLAEDGKLS